MHYCYFLPIEYTPDGCLENGLSETIYFLKVLFAQVNPFKLPYQEFRSKKMRISYINNFNYSRDYIMVRGQLFIGRLHFCICWEALVALVSDNLFKKVCVANSLRRYT